MPFDPDIFFEEHYDEIEKVIKSVSRKKTNQPEEIEECISYTFEQLLRNDYAVLRKFDEGRGARLQTYLYTVINRLLIDKLRQDGTLRPVPDDVPTGDVPNSKPGIGYFRNSTYAKSHGIFGESLERLLLQKNHSFDEAFGILTNNPEFSWTKEKTLKIAHDLCGPKEIPEEIKNDKIKKAFGYENFESKGYILDTAFEKALQGLDHEESLIVKLRFRDGKSVSAISRERCFLNKRSRKVVDRICSNFFGRLKSISLADGMDNDDMSRMIKKR